ncbi:unnamed protein product [Cyprideis torosa]|uniref:Protein pelota homolog n=1 Tax=Cyprideis torosa TaxID=163714 RepID=A0A7R8W4V9_9CRUS|nr:unnamed protein product [Cyprideis torosa]CAG0884494.1 unnamed protein product [Cyprideis torosa]
MKLTHRALERDRSGSMGLIPENSEDMWHAYNLIQAGDTVRSSTFRKVQVETGSGSAASNRVRTTLTIAVETVDFDANDGVLRVKGKNVVENEYVRLGAYHTLDLEVNRKFTLGKHEWDSIDLDRVNNACDPSQHADLAAVLVQEGLANVLLVTASMTLVRAKIDVHIPRKRKGNASQHDKGVIKFFEAVMQAVLRHVNFEVVKCVLLAGPGFVKDQFFEWMYQEAVKTENKLLIENKGKFMLVHASSGFKHSLKEILANPAVTSKISNTKASAEVKALQEFNTMLMTNPARAFYSLKHVLKAQEAGAIETLLISETLFRSTDIGKRKEYVRLVEAVKDSGAEVRIFSSLHPSGQQLDQLSGIAAILRFPMEELEDEPDSDSDDD